MNDNVFRLIMTIIPVLGAIITGFIVPWLKAKIDTEKLEQYMIWADRAVAYAQQVYTPEQWAEKKEYCMDFLMGMFGNALTKAQINLLIESAVKSLKLEEQAVGK